MTELAVFTRPREIEPRWARRGDEIALFATHYTDAASLAVRTVELASLADAGDAMIAWRPIVEGPVLVPGEAGRHIVRVELGAPTGVESITLKDGEQIVIRERVTVEPWDVAEIDQAIAGMRGQVAQRWCGNIIDGIPCGMVEHTGPCDPDPAADDDVPGAAAIGDPQMVPHGCDGNPCTIPHHHPEENGAI